VCFSKLVTYLTNPYTSAFRLSSFLGTDRNKPEQTDAFTLIIFLSVHLYISLSYLYLFTLFSAFCSVFCLVFPLLSASFLYKGKTRRELCFFLETYPTILEICHQSCFVCFLKNVKYQEANKIKNTHTHFYILNKFFFQQHFVTRSVYRS
jgi:hypothetical protein